MTQDVSEKWVPLTPPPGLDLEGFKQFVFDEMQRLGLVLQETTALDLRPVYREPTRPREGMIVFADGTEWDPTSDGAGLYVYRAGAWHKLAEVP